MRKAFTSGFIREGIRFQIDAVAYRNSRFRDKEQKTYMQIETERLILREMNTDDYEALYSVLADSDIMQHYPYTFDENMQWQ